jgi:outer membrane protein assembly factor BamB
MGHSSCAIAALVLVLVACSAVPPRLASNWPAAGGPDGSWQVRDVPAAPTHWSVVRNENIVWRTPLPEGGQSGIAVWGDKLFLTTLKAWPETRTDAPKFGHEVTGYCLDAQTGTVLWSVELAGSVDCPYLYAYSDASSPTPLCDGRHVFFYNASGAMGCYDLAGRRVWERQWRPWSPDDGYPFNKQFEPIDVGDCVLNLEPLDADDPRAASQRGWNYLRALDKVTGATRWIADDATTTYNTPVLGHTKGGEPAVMHGRGGWHGVPETPVGLSLTSLAPGHEGRTLWRYVADTDGNGKALTVSGSLGAPTWQALYVQHWDREGAYWFQHNPIESHLVLDATTGELLRRQSLVEHVDWRRFDTATQRYVLHADCNLRELPDPAPRLHFDASKNVLFVHPAWHCNLVVGDWHWFLCSTAHDRNGGENASRPGRRGIAGPSHCVGRVNVRTGKVEYLELPVAVERVVGKPDQFVYGVARRTKTTNSRGIDTAQEDRSRTDGWEIPAFWGSPIAVNGVVYFTTTLGLTYALNGLVPVLDEAALLAVNDLGACDDTWSLNSMSYANGRLFHRTLREVVCIGASRETP